MAEKTTKVIGTIRVGDEPFFEVVDKGDAHLEIRFVYEPEHGLRIPKKLVTALTEILKTYDGRRRHLRYLWSEEAQITSLDNRIQILARTTNVSESGVFVESLAALPRGAEVSLKVPPKKPIIEARTLIRNLREGVGMGLQFTSLKPASRRKFAKLLEKVSEHIAS
ncbi:MAG: PilZ domain-containing protein [Terriglobia bacterium]